jgi:hypothetical protein
VPLPFPLPFEIETGAGTGVDIEGALLREKGPRAGPRGVTRCRFEEAFNAGESGRYLGLAVRMNVCRSALIDFVTHPAYVWVLVVYAT